MAGIDNQRKNQLLGILNQETSETMVSLSDDVYQDPRSSSDDEQQTTIISLKKNQKKNIKSSKRKKITVTIKKSQKPTCSSSHVDSSSGSDLDSNSIDCDDNSSFSSDYDHSSESEADEVKNMYRNLGLPTSGNKYKTRYDIKRDESGEIIDKAPDMTESEFHKFNQIIAPSIVNPVQSFKRKEKKALKLKDDDRMEKFEDEDYIKLCGIIQRMKTKFNLDKTSKHIQKVKQDAIISAKRTSRNFTKYDIYFDLKYFNSMRVLSTEWKSAILNDQNVEIPFIYLQTLETAGVGAVPYHFFSCVQMLEAYGMTVTTLEETDFSCTYRAFFSGKVKQQIKTDDITALREKAKQMNKDKIQPKKEGGSSAGSYSVPPDSYKETLYFASEASGVDRLKDAEKMAAKHERPIRLFDTRKILSEDEKKEKKRNNIMNMNLNLNVQINDESDEEIDYLSYSDDDEKRDEMLYEDESKIKNTSSNYDYLLNGFTREMVNSLNLSSKFMNKKSIDSIARNQTELSAWIENHLCIDICIFPGLNSTNDKDKEIERQLLFMFALRDQNPYTFLLMNLPDVEKKSKQSLLLE